ncbi:MAG: hypothetical protein E7328_03870 [Clostridiales bacterium]|nr:hypothetical protein [Clostridiales bacterium]
MKKICLTVFVFLLCFLLCSCGPAKELDPELYGYWECTSEYLPFSAYEFQDDGKVIFVYSGGDRETFEYSAHEGILTIHIASTSHGDAALCFEYTVGKLKDNPNQKILILSEQEADGSTGTQLVYYKR